MQKNATIATMFEAVLNEVLMLDNEAVTALCNNRVTCNEELAKHSKAQVLQLGEHTVVGMLGIVNSICEAITGCKIAAVYDDDLTHIKGFKVLNLNTLPAAYIVHHKQGDVTRSAISAG